jgi:hypothetical protein
MATLLIVHHTPSPALHAMFDAVMSGATDDRIEGVAVMARPALSASAVDVLDAHGYCSVRQRTSGTCPAP